MSGGRPSRLASRAPQGEELANLDSRSGSDPRHQSSQRPHPQRHAPLCWRKSGPGDVDEHGASPPGHARARVVVDFDNQIIEMIVAPQPVPGLAGRQFKGPVVAPVGGILAPGVIAPDAANRQPRHWPDPAVRAPPEPHHPKPAARRRAITLALVGPDAAAAERHRQNPRASEQPAFRLVARSGPYPQGLEGRRHAERLVERNKSFAPAVNETARRRV